MLNTLGIVQLDLGAKSSNVEDHGNLIGLVSSYTTADSNIHVLADVWFQMDARVQLLEVQLPDAQPALLVGVSNVTDLG
jgi:hypothetical protein